MVKRKRFLTLGICVMMVFIMASCLNNKENPQNGQYIHHDNLKQYPSLITSWYIQGPISSEMSETDFKVFLMASTEFHNSSTPDSLNAIWHDGIYIPRYNQLDIKEIFGMRSVDSLLDYTFYISSELQSEEEADLILNIKTGLECEHYLNGQQLVRKDIQGENYFPIHVRRGVNTFVARARVKNPDTWFEAQILDSLNVASMFVNGQANNILFPEISPTNKNALLTNAHQNVLDTDVFIRITDVKGNDVQHFSLIKDTFTYNLPNLKENTSYLCTMTIAGQTVRQPIVCGNYDEMFALFQQRRQNIDKSHPCSQEIDELLYRLKFLLEHETRYHDWWWQFKIPPILYQLEHTFAHLEQEIGDESTAFNIQFITYRSPLDEGWQRYLLVTPDRIERGRKYPLAIIIRPQVQNHYPFFVSPQFAHQWAINIMQGLANRHDCIIMMPEARMYQDEDMIPFAMAEMQYAVNHVKQHYNIDGKKIYLHGICSGGYRALKIATFYPDMFAAIGLFAPSYHQDAETEWEQMYSLESNIHKLKDTPIFLFADPFDKHTPYEIYEPLINDCKKYDIPLTFVQKINTELLYNAVVAGREAFEFFDGKVNTRKPLSSSWISPGTAIADFYAAPFMYVYSHENNSEHYVKMIKAMSDTYEEYLYTPLPIVEENELTDDIIATKNLFLIGTKFRSEKLQELLLAAESECAGILPDSVNSLSLHHSPKDRNRLFIWNRIFPNDGSLLPHPWIDGTKAYFVADGTE